MKIITPTTYTLISSNVADTQYAAWNSATSYSIGNIVSFTNHGEYQALTANTNKDPSLNPTDWVFLGTTNRWRMFDQFLNTQTINAGSIVATILAYDVKAIFVGNVSADSVRIQVVDNISSNIIEDATYSLLNEPLDWLQYFYNPVTFQRNSVVHERTTLQRDVSITITATSSGNAAIGSLLLGQVYSIGTTLWNFRVSALDYSAVATDTQTGATYLSKGNYAKLWDGQMFIKTDGSDAIYSYLISIQGTPAVFYDRPNTTLVYGFIKTFDMTLSGAVETRLDIKLQGLI